MSLSELAKPYYSPEEIASVLMQSGYRAEIDQLPSGRKVIKLAASGFMFSLYLYGPKEHPNRVNSVQFTICFSKKPTLESTNKWNAEKRFVKAYCDDDGDLWLEWDVIATFVAPAFFKECLEYWDLFVADGSRM